MIINQPAFDTGRLAERLARGYYAYTAALQIARHPQASVLMPVTEREQIVPVGRVFRNDGSAHVYDFGVYLDLAKSDRELGTDLQILWLSASLLTVGDALAQHSYFDRAPELELLRHLRNGIAHGNRFRIDRPDSLIPYPAHNRLAWIRSDTKSEFEIESSLHGRQVLFEFMGPGDVLDLLMSVGFYLVRMGTGDALRPATNGA